MALIGFFDILGTKEAVMTDRFSDLHALDFAAPASVAAQYFPSLRVAVFSDSVIISAEKGSEIDFVKAIALMYSQWWADFILVRGGIAFGDIRWVDYETSDKIFRNCSNLACARVYGKGLVLAYELEQRAGPGAIPYLTEQAAGIISKVNKNCVLPGVSLMLSWAPKKRAEMLSKYAEIYLEHQPQEGAARRHGLATKHYWEQINAQKKYLPESFDIFHVPDQS